MATLRLAAFAGVRATATMLSDPDLDLLRSRPDFPLHLMDLAFPADPLARGDGTALPPPAHKAVRIANFCPLAC